MQWQCDAEFGQYTALFYATEAARYHIGILMEIVLYIGSNRCQYVTSVMQFQALHCDCYDVCYTYWRMYILQERD